MSRARGQHHPELQRAFRRRNRRGRCYELAWNAVIDARAGGRWRLVHGTLGGDFVEGGSIGHAWLQTETEAFDPVSLTIRPIALYIEKYNAVTIAIFDAEAAAAMAVRHGHFGPWPQD